MSLSTRIRQCLTKLREQCAVAAEQWGWGRSKRPPAAKQSSLGYRGELAAAAFLERLGYRIVCHGYETPDGELDLIAVDGDIVVYVEVKTLKRPGSRPEAAVHRNKRRQLIKLARAFAASRGLLHQRSRFDVVAVIWPDPDREPEIRHHLHAFRDDQHQRGVFRWEH